MHESWERAFPSIRTEGQKRGGFQPGNDGLFSEKRPGTDSPNDDYVGEIAEKGLRFPVWDHDLCTGKFGRNKIPRGFKEIILTRGIDRKKEINN
jgi:hypothetical protein